MKEEREEKLMRIGVSLPSNLLRRFDSIIKERGYSSRSEGIRDAIRNYIVEYEWMSGESGERVGVVTFIYDHERKGIDSELVDLQHHFIDVIRTSLHIHLDKSNCLEVVIVGGDAKRLKELTERIMSLKGVKHVKLTTTQKV